MQLLTELSRPTFHYSAIPESRYVVSLPLKMHGSTSFHNPFPMSAEDEEEIKLQVQRLLSEGKIELTGPGMFQSACFLVDESSKRRLVFDYRHVNALLQVYYYPLPKIPDLLRQASKYRYFAKIDICSAFHHLPLDSASRDLTAFAVGGKRYRWKVVPFGIASAPAEMHGWLSSLLPDLPGLFWYIDDILLCADSLKELYEKMARLLRVLKQEGITLKPGKSAVGVEEVEFLGHTLSHRSVLPSRSYCVKLSEMPRPETVGACRRWLGAVNWISRFIPRYAQLLHPICTLLKGASQRRSKVKWNEECEAAWLHVARCMEDPTAQCPVNPHKPLFLEVDASTSGVGAVLFQKGKAEARHVVGLFSKAMTPSAAPGMMELKGVQLALRQFRPLIGGTRTVVCTDHKPNLATNLTKGDTRRRLRILEELRDYNLEWQFIPGRLHALADWMSRDGTHCAPIAPTCLVQQRQAFLRRL